MKKFEKHEKYPDEYVRTYVDEIVDMNYSKAQYDNLHENVHLPAIELKNEMKKGLNVLFEAKDMLYKSLMKLDLMKSKLMPAAVSKDQIMNLFKQMKEID
jgi:hypothetical protein